MTGTPLLAVQGVTKTFGGVRANVDVSFDVRAGEIVGLIGPNGAGKTSMFNAIAGEVTPDAGTILLEGRGSPASARSPAPPPASPGRSRWCAPSTA